MDEWEIAILAIACLVAVTSLVRLMRQRHDSILDFIARQIEQHQQPGKKRAEQQKHDDPPP